MRKYGTCAVLAGLLVLLGGAFQAQGVTTLVTSRAALAGTDFVDWGQLGPPVTLAPNPSAVISNGGVHLTVSQAFDGSFGRRDQNNGVVDTGWNGNFGSGDHLLWTDTFTSHVNNPLTLSNFNNSIGGIFSGGAQIQINAFGGFVARITAYDSLNHILRTSAVTGEAHLSLPGDNTAIFLGFQSDQVISKMTFSIDAAAGGAIGDFAINQFDFTAPGTPAVPEPLTMLGASLGIGSIGAYLRRRVRGQQASV